MSPKVLGEPVFQIGGKALLKVPTILLDLRYDVAQIVKQDLVVFLVLRVGHVP